MRLIHLLITFLLVSVAVSAQSFVVDHAKVTAIVAVILFARVYGSVHYFSDIFAGCLIGYFVGVLILKLESKIKFLK